jgi:hypothetical protein
VSPVSVPPCPADVTNHGEYVSGVAQSTPPGPEHGQIVSAAAQSDCGKSGSTSTTDPAKTSSVAAASPAHHANPNANKAKGAGSKPGHGGKH